MNCVWERKIDMVLKGSGNITFSTETCRRLNLPCPAVMFTYILIISRDTQHPDIHVDIFVIKNTIFPLTELMLNVRNYYISPHSPLICIMFPQSVPVLGNSTLRWRRPTGCSTRLVCSMRRCCRWSRNTRMTHAPGSAPWRPNMAG